MSIRESALRCAVLKALRDAISVEYENARTEAETELSKLEADTGATSVKVHLGDEHIATLSRTMWNPKAHVVSERLFLEWCAENHPTEIETRVRDSFKKVVLASAVKTGEDIPGVVVDMAAPYVSTRFTKSGPALVAEAWRTGNLSHLVGQVTPELETGDE